MFVFYFRCQVLQGSRIVKNFLIYNYGYNNTIWTQDTSVSYQIPYNSLNVQCFFWTFVSFISFIIHQKYQLYHGKFSLLAKDSSCYSILNQHSKRKIYIGNLVKNLPFIYDIKPINKKELAKQNQKYKENEEWIKTETNWYRMWQNMTK